MVAPGIRVQMSDFQSNVNEIWLTENTKDGSDAELTANTTVADYISGLESHHCNELAARFLELFPASHGSEAGTLDSSRYAATSCVSTWLYPNGGEGSNVKSNITH
jgi:hypothetical protein